MLTVDFNRLGINPGDRILDIGCGSGRHTCEAARFENVTVVGIDIHFHEVRAAKNNLLLQDGLGLTAGRWLTLAADLTDLPFTDRFFDLVICSEVLEHVPNQRFALDEMVRVLKPDKNFVVSVPRYWPERICWRISREYRSTAEGHVRIYKKTELVRLLEGAGLKHWASHYAHSLHSPFWWLKCLVGPSKKDSTIVDLYHRFLIWDMMKKPALTRFLERLLNPVLGKSTVLYLKR